MSNSTADAFTNQQTRHYEAGRRAFLSGWKVTDNTYKNHTPASRDAWMNGFLDAEQSEITGRVCEIRR